MNHVSESLLIKFCENLPLSLTVFEGNGQCKRQNPECPYCERIGETYLCKKKTYTPQEHKVAARA
jgi:hypothetical protein